MRLERIILEGFKSYAHRQEISDLDHHFNAITGLNGSGKSNIFDAICFVMGISNLKRVRAEDTRDLIFKSGNAGIQKASVTIEFTNDDERTAPPSYSPAEFPVIRVCRQIQVSGKQKFFLNERVSDQTKVKNFFHSAMLNVDNPHFMVLQGTVHKMMDMRSAEILGLLEEASGTRVFDTRRRTAENLLKSKEKRVESINASIDEISPRVDAMKQQKEEYQTFVHARETFAEKCRFAQAHDYWRLLRGNEERQTRLGQLTAAMASSRQTLTDIPARRAEISRAVSELEAATNGGGGNALEQLHAAEQEARREVTRSRALIEASEKAFKQAEKDHKGLDAERAKNKLQLDKFQEETSRIRQDHQSQRQEHDAAEQAILNLKNSLRLHRAGVQTGLNGVSIEEERGTLKKRSIEVEGELRRTAERASRLKQEAARLKQSADKDSAEVAALEGELAKAQEAVGQSSAALEPFKKALSRKRTLEESLQEHQRQRSRAHEEIMANGGFIAQPLQHEPIPGIDFDRCLRGRVGELCLAKDAKYSKALTVGATAAALGRFVVTDDSVAKALLERGRLRSRVQFLPLNRLEAAPRYSDAQLSAARTIAAECGGFVEPGVNLVSFDADYERVAAITFGTFVVCSDHKLALRLASDPVARMKAVSLDGDMADPSGIVSGGSAKGLRDYISEFLKLSHLRTPLRKIDANIASMRSELTAASADVTKGQSYADRLEDAEANLMRVKQSLAGLREGGALARLEQITSETAEAASLAARLEEEKAQLLSRMAELDRVVNTDPRTVEREIQAKLDHEEKRLKLARQAIDKGAESFDDAESRKVDLEQRSIDIAAELAAKAQEIIDRRAERERLQEVLAQHSAADAEIKERIRLEQQKSDALHRQHTELTAELSTLQHAEERAIKDSKDADAAIKIVRRDMEVDARTAEQRLRDHAWMQEEAPRFGAADGPYYFEDEGRTAAALQELESLKSVLQRSERSVNERASMLYDEYNRDLATLVAQRATLGSDREVILASIVAVEDRKWGTLDKMFTRVSNVFGALFGMCLPGAAAKLVDERDHASKRLIGLQVKVAFNGVEKESLTELSGGQRSLLALCLILAILRVRPAPVYILDEVDAALDPSHTQNIGRMLQTHFPTSQFLLVSLKDGMFNNANVLYEIRNTQGFSEVTRRQAKRN